jgi:hypothetical protein
LGPSNGSKSSPIATVTDADASASASTASLESITRTSLHENVERDLVNISSKVLAFEENKISRKSFTEGRCQLYSLGIFKFESPFQSFEKRGISLENKEDFMFSHASIPIAKIKQQITPRCDRASKFNNFQTLSLISCRLWPSLYSLLYRREFDHHFFIHSVVMTSRLHLP